MKCVTFDMMVLIPCSANPCYYWLPDQDSNLETPDPESGVGGVGFTILISYKSLIIKG